MQKVYSNEIVYAGFFARLAAWLIDWCILLPCLFLIKLPFGLADMSSGASLFSTAVFFRFTAKDIVRYICVLAYFVILTYKKGGTLGKQAMNLRVVSADGKDPDLFTVLYRESIGKFLSKISIGIGYLLIGADREKAALHDRLSDTRIIYARKIKLYPVIQRVPRTAPYAPVEAGIVEPGLRPGTTESGLVKPAHMGFGSSESGSSESDSARPGTADSVSRKGEGAGHEEDRF